MSMIGHGAHLVWQADQSSKQHRTQAAHEEAMGITMSVDYAFMIAEEADDKTAPVLVA